MGFCYAETSPEEVVTNTLKMYSSNDHRLVAHRFNPETMTLWMVVGSSAYPNIIVACYLDYHEPSGLWGANELCEEMGLGAVDCPVEFLGMAPNPQPSEWWRNLVRIANGVQPINDDGPQLKSVDVVK
jgi:hypothetical protein